MEKKEKERKGVDALAPQFTTAMGLRSQLMLNNSCLHHR